LSFSLSRALSSTAVAAAAVRQLLTRSLAACAAVMVARGISCALPAWLFNIKLFQNERKLDLLKDKRYNNTARCLAGDILSQNRCKK
jgi:hypothetical protein